MHTQETLQAQLEESIDHGDRPRVNELVGLIEPKEIRDIDGIRFLETLKRAKYFPELAVGAEKFTLAGFDQPRITKLRCQALIDQGKLDTAVAVLSDINRKLEWDVEEKSEIVGLLGRANKQRFVLNGDAQYLERAMEFYQSGWDNKVGDHRWHGINFVALLARQDRDNSSNSNNEEIALISSKILEEIEILELDRKATLWDYGTAMEASIATGQENDVFKWAGRYARHPDADSFELGGTIRQLIEIWQYEKGETEKRLLPVLQFELINRSGSSLNLNQVQFYDGKGFEAVYGNEGPIRLEWFKTLLKKCKSVVKIVHKTDGRGLGSGFVVKGSDFKSGWGDESLLITNAHVVSDDPNEPKAFRPDQVKVEFTEADGCPKFLLGEKVFYSDKNILDVWISKIQSPELNSVLGLSFYSPAIPKSGERVERIYVAGHPGGGDFCVSMYDNDLVGFEHPHVHYKSPTNRGSSGGPAMNSDLDAFAVHHKARDDLSLNQGILLSEVKKMIGS